MEMAIPKKPPTPMDHFPVTHQIKNPDAIPTTKAINSLLKIEFAAVVMTWRKPSLRERY